MELVSQRVKITDDINPSALGLSDQIRVLFSKLSNNDREELNVSTKLSKANLSGAAALDIFFDIAIKQMEDRGETSVTVEIASELLSFYDEVTDPVYGKGKFYDFTLTKKDYPITYHYYSVVKIEKKSSTKTQQIA